jgi:crossover junction endodeoxyribonuclease RuvC
MIILGIDPGIARCGWGVINKEGSKIKFIDYGCIETDKELFPGERLEMIYNDLVKIIKEYKPVVAVVELLFFAKNTKTAMAVSQTRGVILLTLRQHRVLVQEFTPDQIKSAVTGSGRADKKQVQKMVKMILNLDHIPQPDDAADGLAAALTESQTLRVKVGL